MADFKVNLDISSLKQYLEGFAKEISEDLQKSVAGLATAAHARIKDEASNKLHSFRGKYLESLSHPQQIDAYNWVITLDDKAAWLELGKEAWDMKGQPGQWGLLKKPDGHTKDGRAYKIIPLEHGKAPTEEASGRTLGANGQPLGKGYEGMMSAILKSELKKRGIPTGRFNKLAINPKTGTHLGPVDLSTGQPTPYKVAGFSTARGGVPGKGNTGIFERVGVYQKYNAKTGGAERHFTTFRMAIEGDGKWNHPAAPALRIFEETAKWSESKWVNEILPAIMEKYK